MKFSTTPVLIASLTLASPLLAAPTPRQPANEYSPDLRNGGERSPLLGVEVDLGGRGKNEGWGLGLRSERMPGPLGRRWGMKRQLPVDHSNTPHPNVPNPPVTVPGGGSLSAESLPDAASGVSALGATPPSGQQSLLQPVTGLLGGITAPLTSTLGGTPLGGVVNTVGGVANGLTGTLDGILSPVAGTATGILSGLTGGAVNGLLKPVTGQLGGLTSTIGGLTNSLPLDSIPIVGGPVKGVLNGVLGGLDGLNLGNGLPLGLGSLATDPSQLVQNGLGTVGGIAQSQNQGQAAFSGQMGSLSHSLPTPLSTAEGQGEKVIQELGGGKYLTNTGRVIEILQSASGSTPVGTVADKIHGGIDTASSGFDTLTSTANGMTGGNANPVVNTASNGERVVKDLGNGQFLTNAGRVVQILTSAPSTAQGLASNVPGLVSGLPSTAQSLSSNLPGPASGIPGSVVGTEKSITHDLPNPLGMVSSSTGLGGAIENAQSRLNGLPVAGTLLGNGVSTSQDLLHSATSTIVNNSPIGQVGQYIKIGNQILPLSALMNSNPANGIINYNIDTGKESPVAAFINSGQNQTIINPVGGVNSTTGDKLPNLPVAIPNNNVTHSIPIKIKSAEDGVGVGSFEMDGNLEDFMNQNIGQESIQPIDYLTGNDMSEQGPITSASAITQSNTGNNQDITTLEDTIQSESDEYMGGGKSKWSMGWKSGSSASASGTISPSARTSSMPASFGAAVAASPTSTSITSTSTSMTGSVIWSGAASPAPAPTNQPSPSSSEISGNWGEFVSA